MLLQGRWDHVYHDTERTQKAFTHNAAQWDFYKAGRYLHTIAEAKMNYEDDAGEFHMHTVLPDGFHDSRFFIDARQRAFVALPHKQQVFQRSYTMLFISPHFSFNAAGSLSERRQTAVFSPTWAAWLAYEAFLRPTWWPKWG